ncbi:MAG: TetR/AcrR family transcriptional regulator [Spirochaetia bacterium]|nr:TetR/AcrR family transcriptional regulator [Spirochaetia bacterium]
MRITKDPEDRKQEILDTAMRLFHEKGYEKTSMSDIAKKMGVAQGLCYRYFPSKEALFNSSIDRYAQLLVDWNLSRQKADMSLKERIEEMTIFEETQNPDYYVVFHQIENVSFHELLSLSVCRKMIPHVRDWAEQARQRGEIHIDDLDTAVSFCIYGQLGILLDHNLSVSEKESRIKSFLLTVLKF